MSHLHPDEGGAGMPSRLRSQIHAGDERSGLAHPRTTRLRPQIHANEDGAGVTSHRRGKRLRPQTRASKDGDDMSGRRGTSPEQPASLPDNQDMLWEILLRLPQDLYSLHRASAVCKQWRGILVDPRFLCLFHAHHRKPPLLGFFHYSSKQIVFKPVLAPPDCITPGRFSLGHYSNHILLDSRHGRVLVKGLQLGEVAVCDPITSKHHRVSIPPEFNGRLFKAAVLCAASNQGHVHGGCHLCPFKVVLVMIYSEGQPIASVYSSETATWSGLISTEPPHDGCFLNGRGTLVGNVLYWPLNMRGHNILEFDLDTQNLTVIKGPPDMHMIDLHNFHIIEAEDGAVGLARVSCLKLLLWQRKIDCQGIPIWFLWKTISWRKLLKITKKRQWLKVVGYDEDNNVILFDVHDVIYMVQPKSMQARKLDGTRFTCRCYTFTSFYPLGTSIDDGTNGAEMSG
ncbi:hypothetical protein VPH35_057248 [Triticum aestivum]|uniref:uncharacterized protein n=1 Tax=Triticum aestivum TaxID=4565 RepID=UPI001D003C06|nr:uncharacterized protein LOC123073628 [Triticum aestivum]